MARKYAIGAIAGLAGQVVTHVANAIINVGEYLGLGTRTFDLTYSYAVTPADVAAGAAEGTRLHIAIQDVPVSASAAQIRLAILRARKKMRDLELFGSDRQTFKFKDLISND
jgi:hypothetical protein